MNRFAVSLGLAVVLLGATVSEVAAQFDMNKNIRTRTSQQGIKTSYRWTGGSSGKSLVGRLPMESAPMQYGGTSMQGAAADGYLFLVGDRTRYPFVRSIEPVVMGPNSSFTPSPMATPTPSRRFFSRQP